MVAFFVFIYNNLFNEIIDMLNYLEHGIIVITGERC